MKDLERDKIKAVQLKIKAGFEVEVFGERSARNAPMEED